LLLQLLMALLAGGAVVWFLARAWCPVIGQAIGQLPERGEIRGQRLCINGPPPGLLAANQYLALTVALGQEPAQVSQADLVVVFRTEGIELCTLVGCLKLVYPAGYVIQFNRPELLPWWGAWRPVLLGGSGAAIGLGGLVLWNIVATVYAVVLRLVPRRLRRALTLGAGWKLASAALVPGALLLVAGLILYGLGVVDWLRLGLIVAFHILLGWIYILTALPLLPQGPPKPRTSSNPFAPPPSPDSTGPDTEPAGSQPAESKRG
jgi:hypothetical protein